MCLVRANVGVALVTAVYSVIYLFAADQVYQREKQVARNIESVGGSIEFEYCVPDWFPGLESFRRIAVVNLRRRGEPIPASLFSALGQLTNLRELNLNLAGTQVTDDELENFANLTSLNVLSLSNTKTTDLGLKHLKRLTNLRSLVIDRTQITDTGLENLQGFTNLKGLNLSSTQITDSGLEHLKGLVTLKGLDLSHTQTTAKGRVSLRTALPNCLVWPSAESVE